MLVFSIHGQIKHKFVAPSNNLVQATINFSFKQKRGCLFRWRWSTADAPRIFHGTWEGRIIFDQKGAEGSGKDRHNTAVEIDPNS